MLVLLFFLAALAVPAQEKGRAVETIRCLADPSQAHALYVPSLVSRLDDERQTALSQLHARWKRIASGTNAADDCAERRQSPQ